MKSRGQNLFRTVEKSWIGRTIWSQWSFKKYFFRQSLLIFPVLQKLTHMWFFCMYGYLHKPYRVCFFQFAICRYTHACAYSKMHMCLWKKSALPALVRSPMQIKNVVYSPDDFRAIWSTKGDELVSWLLLRSTVRDAPVYQYCIFEHCSKVSNRCWKIPHFVKAFWHKLDIRLA